MYTSADAQQERKLHASLKGSTRKSAYGTAEYYEESELREMRTKAKAAQPELIQPRYLKIADYSGKRRHEYVTRKTRAADVRLALDNMRAIQDGSLPDVGEYIQAHLCAYACDILDALKALKLRKHQDTLRLEISPSGLQLSTKDDTTAVSSQDCPTMTAAGNGVYWIGALSLRDSLALCETAKLPKKNAQGFVSLAQLDIVTTRIYRETDIVDSLRPYCFTLRTVLRLSEQDKHWRSHFYEVEAGKRWTEAAMEPVYSEPGSASISIPEDVPLERMAKALIFEPGHNVIICLRYTEALIDVAVGDGFQAVTYTEPNTTGYVGSLDFTVEPPALPVLINNRTLHIAADGLVCFGSLAGRKCEHSIFDILAKYPPSISIGDATLPRLAGKPTGMLMRAKAGTLQLAITQDAYGEVAHRIDAPAQAAPDTLIVKINPVRYNRIKSLLGKRASLAFVPTDGAYQDKPVWFFADRLAVCLMPMIIEARASEAHSLALWLARFGETIAEADTTQAPSSLPEASVGLDASTQPAASVEPGEPRRATQPIQAQPQPIPQPAPKLLSAPKITGYLPAQASPSTLCSAPKVSRPIHSRKLTGCRYNVAWREAYAEAYRGIRVIARTGTPEQLRAALAIQESPSWRAAVTSWRGSVAAIGYSARARRDAQRSEVSPLVRVLVPERM